MDQDLVNLIVAGGGTLLTALVGFAVKALHKWSAKIGNDYARGVVQRAVDLVKVAVLEVEQTFVAECKDRNGDGKLDADEARLAAEMALARAKSHLSTKGLKELAAVLGAKDLVESFLSSTVEAHVAANKAPAAKKS